MIVFPCIMKLKWKATVSFTWCFNTHLTSNTWVPKKKKKKKYILCVRLSISYENLSPWKARSMAKHIFSKYEFGRITYGNFSGKCTRAADNRALTMCCTMQVNHKHCCELLLLGYYFYSTLRLRKEQSGKVYHSTKLKSKSKDLSKYKFAARAEASSKYSHSLCLTTSISHSDWSSTERLLSNFVALTALHQKFGTKKLKSANS